MMMEIRKKTNLDVAKKSSQKKTGQSKLQGCVIAIFISNFKKNVLFSSRKLESRDGDQIRLKCALKGVHHDVDFESFHIQWLHYPSVKSSKNKGDEVSGKPHISLDFYGKLHLKKSSRIGQIAKGDWGPKRNPESLRSIVPIVRFIPISHLMI